jgi:hypothetical protein
MNAALAEVQNKLRQAFDAIEATYAAKPIGNNKPEQLEISKIRAYAAAYTAFVNARAKLEEART